MKRPIFIMSALVAIALVGPMFMKKPDGTPFIESPLDLFSTIENLFKYSYVINLVLYTGVTQYIHH